MSWREWGIWQSFNTVEDKVFGTISLVMILFLIIMLWSWVRPRCCRCGRAKWNWELVERVVGGSGPETVESAYFCKSNCNKPS